MSLISRTSIWVAAVLLLLIAISLGASADTYKMLESSFTLPGITGNPFDYTQNEVQVTFTAPDGKKVMVPAFFDGGTNWKVRYTPRSRGKYSITSIERNGAFAKGAIPSPATFSVTGSPQPGFVHINPTDKYRFAFDNGQPYFPLGNDVAWRAGPNADVTDFFDQNGSCR